MSDTSTPVTRIARHDAQSVHIRGLDLVDDLMGSMNFTEMIYFALLGVRPTQAQRSVLDAALVALMEHGLTPSAIAARLIYSSSPESLQAGVAAGLLGVGTVFVGTIEGCADILVEVVASPDREEAARRIVADRRARKQPVAGFGHPHFRPDDPRAIKMIQIAERAGVAGAHVEALKLVSRCVDEAYGRHLTINVTGAIAATLADSGLPPRILRGAALISRCAGLVAHLAEEQVDPTMRHVWSLVEAGVPYQEPQGAGPRAE